MATLLAQAFRMGLRNARSEQVANGVWHRTEQEWAHIEKPIKLLDHEIARFADKHGINISKNKKDWPKRSLRWGNDIQCLIQFYLADQDTPNSEFMDLCVTGQRKAKVLEARVSNT